MNMIFFQQLKMLARISTSVLLCLIVSCHGSSIKKQDNENILKLMSPLIETMEEIEEKLMKEQSNIKENVKAYPLKRKY